MTPKISIFIKSWPRDFGWLAYCLRSIQRFVTGYYEIVVALPTGHGLPLTKERIVIADEWPDKAKPGAPSPGYYHQMFVKLCADQYCPEADLILLLDSDCVFKRSFDVREMLKDGKPMLLRRQWSDAGDGIIWKSPAEDALCFEAAYDTMVCHPSIYRREDFAELRRHIEWEHGRDFEGFVRSRKCFIEFVTIGNFVLRQHPEAYAAIDYGDGDGYPRPLIQHWSWCGLNQGTRQELEKILA